MTSRFVIITDAWYPQINGVVESIRQTNLILKKRGYDIEIIEPNDFNNFPMPGYTEIRLSFFPAKRLATRLNNLPRKPSHIHIATEGPLGWAARKYCLRHRLPFTTAYHTKFPEYAALRAPIPLSWGYRMMRAFHKPAYNVLVATQGLKETLETYGFDNMAFWGRGVDTILFCPQDVDLDLPKPIHLYVGRVAVEKNLREFLDLSLKGSKVIVGDGPDLAEFRRNYPQVHFMGAQRGEDLARFYAGADVFVFPSRTDTFGLVLLEALACGVPVAALPVTGPIDVLGQSGVASLDNNLERAITASLLINRHECRQFALKYSWDHATESFLAHQADPILIGRD
jgi:glycosyltransferase involved in cell wall biosynthesis